jgi:hypothetical protein
MYRALRIERLLKPETDCGWDCKSQERAMIGCQDGVGIRPSTRLQGVSPRVWQPSLGYTSAPTDPSLERLIQREKKTFRGDKIT